MNPRVRYLIGTLALVAIAFGYALSQGRPHVPPPRPSARPMPVTRPTPAAGAADVLARAEALHLGASQRTRLTALDREWTQESAGLESALDIASRDFSRYMDEQQKTGRVALAEIQRRSEDVRQLGAALRARRQLHADAVAAVLTEDQRREVGVTSAPAPHVEATR